jgi:predicted Zn-dependent protease
MRLVWKCLSAVAVLLPLSCHEAGASDADAEANEKATTLALVSRADAVLAEAWLDNVAAAKVVGSVFAAAQRLAAEKQWEKARTYYEKALQLSPWELEHQLAYAGVLEVLGEKTRAASAARIVFQTTERQELLEESSRISGLAMPSGMEKLPGDPLLEKGICLVRVGPVDEWILQRIGKRLEQTLGAKVYIHPKEIPLPAPDRSFYARWGEGLKKDLPWDHPGVLRLMKELDIESKESATVDQTLELMAQIAELQGQPDPREEQARYKKDAMERDKQWNAASLLGLIANTVQLRMDVVHIGITAGDLYGGDNNYLFGLAANGRSLAICSYCRYTGWFNRERENQSRFLDRVHKQVLSSTGFAFGVPRPTDPRSARSYPNSLEDHDLKGTWLAPECIEGFEKALGRTLPQETKDETAKALKQ